MSSRDLPLWARSLAAILIVASSWWLRETPTLGRVVGDSVALLSLPVVSGFILRGMHLPLGLWPDGPWRGRFAGRTVLGVSVAFGMAFVIFAPRDAVLRDMLDPGMVALVTSGVVAWGFAVGMVRQRRFVSWYLAALAMAAAPLIVALAGGAGWGAGSWRSLGFLTAVGVPASLTVFELPFRRLMIGEPGRAGLVLVLGGAVTFAGWALLAAPIIPVLEAARWIWLIVAVGAGCIYVLSGSPLVSALYSGIVFAGIGALVRADPGEVQGAAHIGWPFAAVLGVVALGLCTVVLHRRGLFAGLR